MYILGCLFLFSGFVLKSEKYNQLHIHPGKNVGGCRIKDEQCRQNDGEKKILALTDPLLCNVGPHRLYMKDCPVSPIWVPRTKRFLQPTVVHVSTVVQATLRYCK